MLCARTDATLHNLSALVPGVSFPTETFSGGSFSFPLGLQERQDWLREPKSLAPGVRLPVVSSAE